MNNNSKKSHKSSCQSPPPPTKLKIITNGNGLTAVPVNGKMRGGRSSKQEQKTTPTASTTTTTTDALDVFTFVSKINIKCLCDACHINIYMDHMIIL